jgi:very-short-patch-repair endonuclease
MKYIDYTENTRKYTSDNRNKPTKAELLVWNMILRKDRLGYRFLRQKPIGQYIIDFYCSKLMLAIEIDGSTHDLKENYDFDRDIKLKQKGIKILHYEDEIVKHKLEYVFDDIKLHIKDREKELNIANSQA